jgi:siroheme synthase
MLGPLATLVGAGPGDYGTITLTAIATMRVQTPGTP